MAAISHFTRSAGLAASADFTTTIIMAGTVIADTIMADGTAVMDTGGIMASRISRTTDDHADSKTAPDGAAL
ncbi:hypothetical protein RHSP_70442 [Rhizobium freirei PRF 81]|uniref:Uncharacterized protein n=1 Tax=Rhizobium freirei PRF 81 TaxID=363754 RepID=N6UT57_9HYPH|nr:hypothetical protein RHSP_70442 [Rhizobium freirei PRF 81]